MTYTVNQGKGQFRETERIISSPTKLVEIGYRVEEKVNQMFSSPKVRKVAIGVTAVAVVMGIGFGLSHLKGANQQEAVNTSYQEQQALKQLQENPGEFLERRERFESAMENYEDEESKREHELVEAFHKSLESEQTVESETTSKLR